MNNSEDNNDSDEDIYKDFAEYNFNEEVAQVWWYSILSKQVKFFKIFMLKKFTFSDLIS